MNCAAFCPICMTVLVGIWVANLFRRKAARRRLYRCAEAAARARNMQTD